MSRGHSIRTAEAGFPRGLVLSPGSAGRGGGFCVIFRVRPDENLLDSCKKVA